MDIEKAAIIRDIKGMLGGRSYQSRGYESLTVYKTVDKLLMRLGIIIIIGLLGFLAFKDYFNNRTCKTR